MCKQSLVVSPPPAVLDLASASLPPARRLELEESLPGRRTGASAFRQAPRNAADLHEWRSRLWSVLDTEQILKFSHQGSLFTYRVPIKDLPRPFEGFTLLFVSDIHLKHGDLWSVWEVESLAGYLRERKIRVDGVILGGDIINDRRADLHPQVLPMLACLAPQSRRFAVLGNHDYNGKSADIVKSALTTGGFRIIEGDCASVSIESARMNLFGLGEKLRGAAPVDKRIEERRGDVNILVTHSLDNVTYKVPDYFDLMLSGHFHGGELRLGPLDGSFYLKIKGESRNINRQTNGWDMLSRRALSWVSPGLARHWPSLSNSPSGVGLLQLMEA